MADSSIRRQRFHGMGGTHGGRAAVNECGGAISSDYFRRGRRYSVHRRSNGTVRAETRFIARAERLLRFSIGERAVGGVPAIANVRFGNFAGARRERGDESIAGAKRGFGGGLEKFAELANTVPELGPGRPTAASGTDHAGSQRTGIAAADFLLFTRRVRYAQRAAGHPAELVLTAGSGDVGVLQRYRRN